jgi:hypothetical protein
MVAVQDTHKGSRSQDLVASRAQPYDMVQTKVKEVVEQVTGGRTWRRYRYVLMYYDFQLLLRFHGRLYRSLSKM